MSGNGPAELRERLVDAAVTAIERDGPEELSLRTIASDAGVSRQAPYLCFADKREMLGAAAAVGIARDRAGWRRAMARAKKPLDRLLALVRAHMRFTREHPHLVAVMHGGYVAKADVEELQKEAIESFALLRETVGACLAPGTSVERQRQFTMIVWATVKGLVDLELNKQIPKSVPGTTDDLMEDAIRSLVRGWVA